MNIHQHRGRRLAGLAAALLLTAIALPARAQAAFPSRPITLVVPFSPGGGNDILARAIAPRLGKLLGQTVIVDNRPGAGGNLGTDFVAKSAPDGHTLVIASSQIVMNPYLGMKVPFRVEKDFAPVGRIASVPIVLVAGTGQPFKTLPEFVQYAKSKPGTLSYSSPGNGTPQHLAGEVFAKLTKTELLHVPYRGTGPSIADLMGGQVQASFATFASAIQFVRTGKLRALGIAGAQRTALLPDLPTFGEAGIKGYDAALWYSLLAPARTPKPVVDKLNAALQAVLASPDVAASLAQQGFEPQPSSPAELQAYIHSEMARWERLVVDYQIKVAL